MDRNEALEHTRLLTMAASNIAAGIITSNQEEAIPPSEHKNYYQTIASNSVYLAKLIHQKSEEAVYGSEVDYK